MIQIQTDHLYIFALILPVLPAFYLHEGTHWFIGVLADTDPKPRWDYLVVPIAVQHGKIESIDSGTIRFLGWGIFLWLPVQFLSIGYLLFEFTPGNLFVAMIPFYILAVSSESDMLAFRDPERYRELEMKDDLPFGSLFYSLLKNRIRG